MSLFLMLSLAPMCARASRRVPAWLVQEILSASQAIGKDRAAAWMSEN